ncbi:unnamed protein product [Staurois parvus]|uniref:Uncharacterized protein n=1 Tax=Staurois parvus TaxID=386267 RepID=A0ABN9A988_9NEOB|nr:unnamed protein product [Staurois parvus]
MLNLIRCAIGRPVEGLAERGGVNGRVIGGQWRRGRGGWRGGGWGRPIQATRLIVAGSL